eukprot:GILI01015222.1.p1 GENE.GILI01015222.1~~GILI01015222.1.p1  ORF type:complete len:208 (-),score=12.72 GILI01015222.1:36-638(-)
MPPLITLVTGNKGKLAEMQAMLGDTQTVRFDISKIDLDELQGESPAEIAKAKALKAFQTLQRPVLIDDTSLCFNALGGLPGPYIKWFLGAMGNEGLPKLLAGFEDKSAYASCIFTLCVDESTVLHFEGRCNGRIVSPRGESGFGWDAVFETTYEDVNLTFAEMSSEVKNKISHRSQALTLFSEYIASVEGTKMLASLAGN